MNNLRPEYAAGRVVGAVLARPGLMVGNGDIQAIIESECCGCGVYLPARAFIDNITGVTWCAACGDSRNSPSGLLDRNTPMVRAQLASGVLDAGS